MWLNQVEANLTRVEGAAELWACTLRVTVLPDPELDALALRAPHYNPQLGRQHDEQKLEQTSTVEMRGADTSRDSERQMLVPASAPLFKVSLLLASGLHAHEFPGYGSYLTNLWGTFQPPAAALYGRGGIVSGGEP